MRPRPRTASLVALAGAAGLAACSGLPLAPGPSPGYRGEVEVYLEPYDAQGVCSVTIGLRNRSGVPQGEAWLQLDWYETGSTPVASGRLRMDPLLAGRYDAKNLTLPVPCARVARVAVRSAEWALDPQEVTREDPAPKDRVRAPIAGVTGTEWPLAWNPELGLYVGGRAPGAPAS